MAGRYTPGTMKNMNVFASGLGMLGYVKTAQLPEVKTKKEVINGMHVDSGLLEPMEAEVELSSFNEVIFAEMSKLAEAKLKVKGDYIENGKNKKFTATLHGSLDVSMDGFESGNGLAQKVKMYVNVYTLEIDGVEIFDIDLPNYIAKISGQDIYEFTRSAIS